MGRKEFIILPPVTVTGTALFLRSFPTQFADNIYRPTRAACRDVLGAQAYRVLIGACTPVLRPTRFRVDRRTLHTDLRELAAVAVRPCARVDIADRLGHCVVSDVPRVHARLRQRAADVRAGCA